MKIDTTAIAGYSEMSAEDKLKALEEFEYEDNAETVVKYKKRIDELTGELSKTKKEADAKKKEIDTKKAEDDDRYKDLESKYNELYKKSTISEYTAKYLSLGWNEKLAKETAEAQADGDLETVFANMSKAKDDLEKEIKAKAVKETPRPEDKGASKVYKSKDEIMDIKDAAERQAAIASNIELFGKR